MGMEAIAFSLTGIGGNEKGTVGAYADALSNANRDYAAIEYYISQMTDGEKEVNKDLIELLNRSKSAIKGLARIISELKVC